MKTAQKQRKATLNVRLAEHDLHTVKRLAKARKSTYSEVIRTAVATYIERL